MSTQPVHRHEPDTFRVRHTIGGISDALRGSRQAQFFAELLRAQQGGGRILLMVERNFTQDHE
jgi:hypothetical protein